MTIYAAINYSTTEKIGHDHPDRWGYNNGFTNQEFGSLRELMIQVWRGFPYCAQHHHIHHPYTDGSGRRTSFRHSLNYWRCNVISLDFDTMTPECSIGSLYTDSFINRYGGALYATRNSKPDAPRTRVVFQTEETIEDAAYYRRLNGALLWSYGKADQSCKDVCRIFAGSPKCEVKMIGGVLTKTHCDVLVARYAEYEAERLAARQAVLESALEAGGSDARTVREALSYIDAEKISYSDWIKILAAIYSVFPGEEGVALVQSWSSHKNGEIETKWRSGFSGQVTMMTLFWMARQNGWPGALKFESNERRANYFASRILQRRL